MFGGIIAVVFAVWFYLTAAKKGAPAIQWALAGLFSFYVPNIIWSVFVAKPKMLALHVQNATSKAGLWGYSSVLIGAVCAFLVWQFFLNRMKPLDND